MTPIHGEETHGTYRSETIIERFQVSDSPAVLLLVRDCDVRERVRQRLLALEVIPIVVRADRAAAAIERYRPIAAVMDRPHAALAPDDFLACSCTNRIRLVTLPEGDVDGSVTNSLLEAAIAVPVAF